MYIKKGEAIPDEKVQIFTYKPIGLSSFSDKTIMKLHSIGVIKEIDMDIVKALYRFQMCTAEQLSRIIHQDETLIETRLYSLIKNRICNSFAIGDSENENVKDDALFVYTIDYGATVLLKHFTDFNDIVGWKIEDYVMTSTKVNKRLMATEFMLRLQETIGDKLVFFNHEPIMSCSKEKYSPTAYFRIRTDAGEKDFILESVREIDFFNGYETHYASKISKGEIILTTQAWKKYVGKDETNPPVVIFLADTDEAMLRMAKLVSTTTIPAFRLCTISSIQGDLSKSLYKYEDDKLKKVIAKIFA